ncbi:MAG: PHP domain-containing protein [Candidatus Pacebacteria bacterium]|nr:PHP domain-containing protein [Candidatus Paceibacterota bacterium]
MLIDLQVHSTYSDGYLTPTQLIKFLSENKIEVAALTDHNTVSGLAEFEEAGKKAKIKTIPGIELYCSLGHRHFNILWYNFDYKSPELHNLLRETQRRRRRKVRKILENLKAKGYRVEVENILDQYNHYLAINKVGGAFYKQNRTKINRELGLNMPREEDILGAYFFSREFGVLKESYINIERVIKLRKKIGGQLIFCHPGKHNKYAGVLPAKLAKLGIDGLEVLSPHHSIGSIIYCQFLAREYNWIETGGSDFHLYAGNRFSLQHAWQWFKIDSKNLRKINQIIKP